MEKPAVTRLRYAKAKKAEEIVLWLSMLGQRVQIYGAPVWVEKERRWYLWFVPGDMSPDIQNADIS